jgi:glyceraldehyde 3-phosphate dehydrogenase
MTKTRIGLMGFGRIGKNVFRMLAGHPDLEVAAIADIDKPEGLTYLLKYDSIYGRFPGSVELEGDNLVFEGRKIPFINAREPGDADWSAHGVDIVVQATGKYRTTADAQKHLDAGARKVIVASTPETPGDIPLLLRGINDDILTDATHIVALGSNTSNALAPILRVLDSSFGIDRAMFTTVHAMTNSLRLADVPTEGFRQSRAAGENIIPGPTNSAEILESAMPEFAGKLNGQALNVPVADGSTIDLVAWVTKATTVEEVNAAVKAASEGIYAGIVEYNTDPIVSSDVRMDTESAVFDSLSTMVMKDTFVKTITWFNNGWGYSTRVIEVAATMAHSLEGASL